MTTQTPPARRWPPEGIEDRAHGASKKVQWLAFGASVAVHALVVLLYAFSGPDWGPMSGTVALDSQEAPAQGMQVVQVVEVAADEPSAETPIEEPEEAEPIVASPTADRPTGPVEAEPGTGEDPVTAADVLTVRVTDARLWKVARPDLLELSEEERMRLALAGRLEAWNDSVLAAREAQSAMMDWTTTDGDGNKWGVSPGKLHLGKLTLPLPFGFGPNPWQAERYAERQAQDRDIQSHSTDQAVRASWKERAEAIRRRRDREREEEEQEQEKPDTTRSRRGGGGIDFP